MQWTKTPRKVEVSFSHEDMIEALCRYAERQLVTALNRDGIKLEMETLNGKPRPRLSWYEADDVSTELKRPALREV